MVMWLTLVVTNWSWYRSSTDRLVGQVLGEVGKLPQVFTELEVNFFLLRRLLGVRTQGSEKQGGAGASAHTGVHYTNSVSLHLCPL